MSVHCGFHFWPPLSCCTHQYNMDECVVEAEATTACSFGFCNCLLCEAILRLCLFLPLRFQFETLRTVLRLSKIQCIFRQDIYEPRSYSRPIIGTRKLMTWRSRYCTVLAVENANDRAAWLNWVHLSVWLFFLRRDDVGGAIYSFCGLARRGCGGGAAAAGAACWPDGRRPE